MHVERRLSRPANPWAALSQLFARRADASEGAAVLADEQGLPLVAAGLAPKDVDRVAAELLRSDAAPLRTGLGLDVFLHTEALSDQEVEALRDGVTRILAQA